MNPCRQLPSHHVVRGLKRLGMIVCVYVYVRVWAKQKRCPRVVRGVRSARLSFLFPPRRLLSLLFFVRQALEHFLFFAARPHPATTVAVAAVFSGPAEIESEARVWVRDGRICAHTHQAWKKGSFF